MKKSLLTLSLVALFTIAAKAQEPQKATVDKKGKKEVVNPDGTTSVVEDKKEEPKKSGTRMAINEKGTAGTNSSTTSKKEASKEKTESTTSPTTKPH